MISDKIKSNDPVFFPVKKHAKKEYNSLLHFKGNNKNMMPVC